MMRKSLKWIFLALALGLWCFAYFDGEAYRRLLAYITNSIPCEKPISYSIERFDTKFGISKKQFLENIATAEKIWEDALGKNLFEISENADLKINLIYDYRQEATEKLQSIGLTINSNKETFDMLKAKFETLSASYKSSKIEIEILAAKIKEEKESYEEQVRYWNDRGGAPKSEYRKLEQQKDILNSRINDLNQKQTALNETASTINSLATVINKLIGELNLNIERYNNSGSIAGEEFDEGVYISDPSGERIEIYQFTDESKLIRVLAHELGHALGMNHVLDPKAIMYRLNQSSSVKATEADKAELNKACKIR